MNSALRCVAEHRTRDPAVRNAGYILMPVVLAIAIIATISMLINRDTGMAVNVTAGANEATQRDNVNRAALQHVLWQVNRNGCTPTSNLTATAFGAHSYTANVVNNGGGNLVTHILPVDQDTWIEENAPTTNYGTDPQLKVKKHPNDAYRALYRFDVSAIATGTAVISAAVRFFVINVDDKGPIGIHRVNTDWTEAGTTWNTMAANFDAAALGFIEEDPPAGQFVEVDLTPTVQNWVNGNLNYGVMLVSTSNNVQSDYTSVEYGNAIQRPELQVVTTDGSAPTEAVVTATVTMDNGVTQTLNHGQVSLYQQPPAQLALQPDAAAGMDTQIYAFAATTNYATDPTMEASPQHRTLLRFPLAALPAQVRVESAQLALYMQSNTGSDGNVAVYRLRSDWDVATTTWIDRTAVDTWATAGGDGDLKPVSTAAVTSVPGWHTWDVTPLVQAWSARSAARQGFLLEKDTSGSAVYTSSEGATADNHPKLTIRYSCGCDVACLSPQGTGDVLMVVGDAVSLSIADAIIKSELELWGYAVNLIEDTATQAAFDAAVIANDAAYVSESTQAVQLGTKLTDAGIGVVYEDGNSNDEFGVSASHSLPTGTHIDVVDTSHFITQSFSAGSIRIKTDSSEILTVNGAVSPGLQVLAEFGGVASLGTLEVGAALQGGGVAKGRRVMLPFGGNAMLNWRYLNNSGRLIAQRSLQWATESAPVTCNGNFRDEFNAASFGNSDGTLGWAGDWEEIGESDGIGGDITVKSDHHVDYMLRVRDNDNGGEGVQRELNLIGAGSASLSFDYRNKNLGNGDWVKVEFSTNGTLGPWVEVDRIEGPLADSGSYATRNHDVTAHISATTAIRILGSPSLGHRDDVWFDNVDIQCAP